MIHKDGDAVVGDNDMGVIGLAVMGENLIMNLERNGFSVSVYNRTAEKVTRFTEGRAKGKKIFGFTDVKEFVASLSKPRKILLMVKAGDAVDSVISILKPHLEEGDILIDGGNSNYKDTERRYGELEGEGLLYIGTGISGGEEGALNGPSIMPGGSKKAWEEVSGILKAISARAGTEPCCEFMGPGGAGHFVKMVHNGIEYGDMQLIAETYHILKSSGMDNEQMADIFSEWNKGKLDSYLIWITSQILSKREDDGYIIDRILDSAGQKGTGRWTAAESLDQGVPLPTITESVYARFISSLVEERKEASTKISKSTRQAELPKLEVLEDALFLSKLLSYAQGFALISKASEAYGWGIDLSEVARVWRAGCIIRSSFLDDVARAFSDEKSANLLLAEKFRPYAGSLQVSLRNTVSYAVLSGIPVPSMSSALAYLDSYTSSRLPANLIQAQRDFFGAHTYERLDKERGERFHTDWTGEGGDTSSGHYDA